jgi:hypothetical protein
MVRSRRSKLSITLIGVLAAAVMGGCPDPDGKYESFVKDSAIPRARTAKACPDEGTLVDITGTYLLAIATNINQARPLEILARVTMAADMSEVSFVFYPLVTWPDPPGTPPARTLIGRIPDEGKTTFTVVDDGSFVIVLGAMDEPVTVDGTANPLSGKDIAVTLTLDATIKGVERFDGLVTGTILKPVEFEGASLEGSRFGAVRIDADPEWVFDVAAVPPAGVDCELPGSAEGEGEGEGEPQVCGLDPASRAGECEEDPELAGRGSVDVIGVLRDFKDRSPVGGEAAKVRLRLLKPSVPALGVTEENYGFLAPCEGGVFEFHSKNITISPTGISADDFDCDETDNWTSVFTATYPTGVVPASVDDTSAYIVSNADALLWTESLRERTGEPDLNLTDAPGGNGCLLARVLDREGKPVEGAIAKRGSDPATAHYFNAEMTGFVEDGTATTASGAFALIKAGIGNYGAEDPSGTNTYKAGLGKGGSEGVCVVVDFFPLPADDAE